MLFRYSQHNVRLLPNIVVKFVLLLLAIAEGCNTSNSNYQRWVRRSSPGRDHTPTSTLRHSYLNLQKHFLLPYSSIHGYCTTSTGTLCTVRVLCATACTTSLAMTLGSAHNFQKFATTKKAKTSHTHHWGFEVFPFFLIFFKSSNFGPLVDLLSCQVLLLSPARLIVILLPEKAKTPTVVGHLGVLFDCSGASSCRSGSLFVAFPLEVAI